MMCVGTGNKHTHTDLRIEIDMTLFPKMEKSSIFVKSIVEFNVEILAQVKLNYNVLPDLQKFQKL